MQQPVVYEIKSESRNSRGKPKKAINSYTIITVFNVGEYRRAATDKYRSHEFFDMNNSEALAIRQ